MQDCHNEAQILKALERGTLNHRKDNKQKGFKGGTWDVISQKKHPPKFASKCF